MAMCVDHHQAMEVSHAAWFAWRAEHDSNAHAGTFGASTGDSSPEPDVGTSSLIEPHD
jgi:hypothetical protein